MESVGDYDDLRGLTPANYSTGDVVYVTGWDGSAYSGIAGHFKVVSGTATDNGGTIITNSTWNTALKHWERIYDNDTIEMDWFEIPTDGTTDAATVFKSTMTWVKNQFPAIKNVKFTPREYYLNDIDQYVLPNVRIDCRGAIFKLNPTKNYSTNFYNRGYGELFNLRNGEGYDLSLCFENAVIDGQGVAANIFGIGPDSKDAVYRIRNVKFRNISSTVKYDSAVSIRIDQDQGGTCFAVELPGGMIAEDCEFEDVFSCFRVHSTSSRTDSMFLIVENIICKDTQVILQTTPSDWGTTEGQIDVAFSEQENMLVLINNVQFKDCGWSSDARTEGVCFEWVDQSPDGAANDNYYPWVGLEDWGNSGSLGGKSNWRPIAWNSSLSEWSATATYSDGNQVKVTNNGRLGCLFYLQQARNVHISNVTGENSYNRNNPAATLPAADGQSGYIGALIAGVCYNCSVTNMKVDVCCDYIYLNGNLGNCSYTHSPIYSTSKIKLQNVLNNGPVMQAVFESNTYIEGTFSSKNDDITVSSTNAYAFKDIEFENVGTNYSIGSKPLIGANALSTSGSNYSESCYFKFELATFGSAKVKRWVGGTIDDFDNSLLPNVTTQSTLPGYVQSFQKILAKTASIFSLPTHADDTAAGTAGLTSGQLYKTSSGSVQVKL